jgi:hypothetical protein
MVFGQVIDLRDVPQPTIHGSTRILHYDHDIPFSRGGSSLTAANVRLLCARHNLEKSDKILSIVAWIFASALGAGHIEKLSG